MCMAPVTIKYTDACRDSARVAEDCAEGGVPITIREREGKVVMVPYDEWAAEQETHLLLSDPVDRLCLTESIAQADRGELVDFRGLKDVENQTN